MSNIGIGKMNFSLTQNLKPNTALFEGTNQYRKYSHLFHNMIEEYEVELKLMGFNPGELGTHICRKVVAIMV